jgi:hypothetical protein
MRPIGKRGCLSKLVLFGEASLRSALADSCHGEEPPRERQHPPVLVRENWPATAPQPNTLSGAARWATEVLPISRMNNLTTRGGVELIEDQHRRKRAVPALPKFFTPLRACRVAKTPSAEEATLPVVVPACPLGSVRPRRSQNNRSPRMLS